jgi:hypothetical protein
MNNTTLIIALSALGAVLVAAFVAIVLFYAGDKGLAIAGLVTVAGLIIPQLLSLKSSTENAAHLKQVDQKVDDNTAITERVAQVATETHLAVNGRMDDLIRKVQELAETQRQLAAAAALAKGIDIGREQVRHD